MPGPSPADKIKYTMIKHEGVPYEEEEIPGEFFMVKELIKTKDFGNLFLSNYKFSFQPNSIKDTSRLDYFIVPYGYIHRVVESRTDMGIQLHIFCKDER
jgi:hypothetical protein